jgi:integrase/recombinase XerD
MTDGWQFYLTSWVRTATSAHTHYYYQTSGELFVEWCKAQGLTGPEQVKPLHLSLYTDHLRGLTVAGKDGAPRPRYTTGGVLSRLKGVRAFFGYLVQMDVLDKSPFATGKFKLPKKEHKLLPVTGYHDFKALMKAAALSDYPLRNQAIVALLFNTGVRVSELCHIRLEDLRYEPGFIRIHGKGNKQRLVPVDPQVLRYVNAYVRRERPDPREVGGEDRLFIGEGKRPLTRWGVRHLITRLCDRASIPRLTVHAFRRGFVVELLTMGGDVATAQKIMGHSTLDMTLHYAQMRDPNLKAVHNRASPGFRRME